MIGLLKNIARLGGILAVLMAVGFETFAQQPTGQDVFLPVEQTVSDEFEPYEENPQAQDEFTEFADSTATACPASCSGCDKKQDNSQLWWVLSALGATILAGFMVRYNATRNLRGFILMASIIILGFYQGGCPCPIRSLQHVIMAGIGETPNWIGMIWFLGLLPVTYVFGKVWCGWICHLGALQEFLFLPGKIKILRSEKAQKIMRIIRMVLIVVLIVQILITRTNLFKTIDPFKVAFNLQASNTIGWILLGLLLLSSVFIFRPFCKTVCPIGLVLGWISKIPGASILSPQKECVGCKVCDNSCKINAITSDGKTSKLDNQECIACGNCASDCKKGSMLFVRNSKKYSSKAVCQKG
jgi:ferredoxin